MNIQNFIEKNDYLNLKKALKSIDDINMEIEIEDDNGEYDYESLLTYAIKNESDNDILILLIDNLYL